MKVKLQLELNKSISLKQVNYKGCQLYIKLNAMKKILSCMITLFLLLKMNAQIVDEFPSFCDFEDNSSCYWFNIENYNDSYWLISSENNGHVFVTALSEANEKQAWLEAEVDLRNVKKAEIVFNYKIENLVKDLEELTNEYLAELSDGRFSLEFVVLNDKLNVEIDDNGKPVDILALSAGELARVNTATLLAIRKLMSSISKSRINVLFLDEVTNVLDELGKEKLVEILLREENLNTYIVSHGWTHPLLSKIEVIKEDKISHLDG